MQKGIHIYTCTANVDFTDIIPDEDVKREVLRWNNLEKSSLPDCIATVEKEEMARYALK